MVRFLLQALLVLSLFCKEPPKLKTHDVTHRINEMLYQHACVQSITSEILSRMLEHYVEEMDRTKSYFLDAEVTPLIKLDKENQNVLKNAILRGDFQYFQHIMDLFKLAIERRNSIESKLDATNLEPKKLENHFETFAQTVEELEQRAVALTQHTLWMAEQIGAEQKQKIVTWAQKRRHHQEAEWLQPTQELQERLLNSCVIKSFASSLDAHSSYFTPEETQDFLIHVHQRLFGIGAVLKDDFDGLSVTKLVEGGPAARSGKIHVDDKIIAVDGEPVMGLSIQEAVALIRGEKGTSVDLTILRKNEHTNVSIVREEVVVEESRYTYEIIHSDEGAILHFWLHTFYDDENHSSAKDFKKIYDEARKQKKLIGVVLDLRENSGGLMSQAVEMCGQFIHRGVVATVIDRYQGKIHLRNMHSPPICKLPVVTLIDRASASSSEIVAQCLKDYGRAIILGDGSSFGKGSYQSLSISDPEKIDPRGEYRLTKGLYYTVSGISPQLNGVTPDVCVPGPLDKLEIGERYTKYALENKSIENNYIDRMEDVNPLWQVRAKKITAHQQNRIPDATIKHLNQASKERLSKVKKKEGISYEEEKQLVLDEAVEVLKHWCKFHESHLRY